VRSVPVVPASAKRTCGSSRRTGAGAARPLQRTRVRRGVAAACPGRRVRSATRRRIRRRPTPPSAPGTPTASAVGSGHHRHPHRPDAGHQLRPARRRHRHRRSQLAALGSGPGHHHPRVHQRLRRRLPTQQRLGERVHREHHDHEQGGADQRLASGLRVPRQPEDHAGMERDLVADGSIGHRQGRGLERVPAHRRLRRDRFQRLIQRGQHRAERLHPQRGSLYGSRHRGCDGRVPGRRPRVAAQRSALTSRCPGRPAPGPVAEPQGAAGRPHRLRRGADDRRGRGARPSHQVVVPPRRTRSPVARSARQYRVRTATNSRKAALGRKYPDVRHPTT
jgi:hypothetical protein